MLRLVAVLVFLLSAAALALVNRVASRPRSQLFTAVDDPASDPARRQLSIHSQLRIEKLKLFRLDDGKIQGRLRGIRSGWRAGGITCRIVDSGECSLDVSVGAGVYQIAASAALLTGFVARKAQDPT